jgi:SagB-type dehydrogenase family enzyme
MLRVFRCLLRCCPRSTSRALNGRRSHRTYGRQPIQQAQISTLLQTAAGPAPGYHEQLRDRHQTTFKTSPSAGGRHPTELYPVIRNVARIEPGVYHYAADAHALERLRGPVDDATAMELCADQPWVADAGMLLFYASFFRRGQFKYNNTRGYRELFLNVGHVSQTVFLLTTALGLRMTFIEIIRDETVEELLGLDLADEFVVGCAVIGTEPGGTDSATGRAGRIFRMINN